MIDVYPKVIDEFRTVAKLKEGYSINRQGDGEAKCIAGKGYVREPANPKLAAELLDAMTNPHPNCLVGIPNFDPRGVKYENWLRHEERFKSMLSPDVTYYSAFITRPDNAQWIDNREYAESLVDLWRGKSVTVVGEFKSKLSRAVSFAAGQIRNVECPHREAYSAIDRLEQEVLKKPMDLVVLSAGPTATCLANRLAKHGLQALDLGSVGGFIIRQLYGGTGPDRKLKR